MARKRKPAEPSAQAATATLEPPAEVQTFAHPAALPPPGRGYANPDPEPLPPLPHTLQMAKERREKVLADQERDEREAEARRKDDEAKTAARTAGKPKDQSKALGRKAAAPEPGERSPQAARAKLWFVRIAPYIRLQIEADTATEAGAKYREALGIRRADLVPEVSEVPAE